MLASSRLTTPSAPAYRDSFRIRNESYVFKTSKKSSARPRGSQSATVRPQALFGGGAAKTASKTAYICKDCGYIYDGRESFESLDKSYRCPVCSSPKRRFTEYNQPVPKGANNMATRKERKADIQAGGGLNPGVIIGVGAVIIAGAFAYLNSVY